jgi:tetratricopeptide (TPR) repeat protein
VAIAIIVALAVSPDLRRVARGLLGSDLPSGEMHVAVLPFNNLGGGDPGQAVCDGLRETMTSRLTQLNMIKKSLWVVPASAVTDRNVVSVSDARTTFGASLAITGSLQNLGELVRLSLNLVDTESERQLRSEIVDVSADDLSALQDSTVSIMVRLFDIREDEGRLDLLTVGGTTAPEAYGAYLAGRGHLQQYTDRASVDSAIERFRHAISIDSKYALAYAGLGEAYWRLFEITNEPEWMTQATGNCQVAVALVDTLSVVTTSLGVIQRELGQYEEAVATFTRALELAPRDHVARRGRAMAHEALGQRSKAEADYREVIEERPGYWAGYFDLGLFYVRNNQFDGAGELLTNAARLVPRNARDINDIGALYYFIGDKGNAQKMWEQAVTLGPDYAAYSNLGYR